MGDDGDAGPSRLLSEPGSEPGSGRAEPPRRRRRPRLVVVGYQALVLDALVAGLEGPCAVTGVLVADDSTTAGAQAAVLRARPDVVLVPLDPRPAFDAVEFAEVLASTGVPVVALTRGAAPAPAHGAAPVVVVPARAGLDELRAAVTRALHAPGGSSPAPDAGTAAGSRQRDGRVDAAHDQRAAARMMARLSPRERQLLEQLMLGRTAVEISHADSVSEATVRTQIRSILTKLEVTSQITAVAIARLAGWHPDSSGQPSWRR